MSRSWFYLCCCSWYLRLAVWWMSGLFVPCPSQSDTTWALTLVQEVLPPLEDWISGKCKTALQVMQILKTVQNLQYKWVLENFFLCEILQALWTQRLKINSALQTGRGCAFFPLKEIAWDTCTVLWTNLLYQEWMLIIFLQKWELLW